MHKKILFASQEAGSGLSYNPELVQGMFLQCLETGSKMITLLQK